MPEILFNVYASVCLFSFTYCYYCYYRAYGHDHNGGGGEYACTYVRMPVWIYGWLDVCILSLSLSLSLPLSLSLSVLICQSIDQSIYQSSIDLSICLSIGLSIYVPIDLSIYICLMSMCVNVICVYI